MYWYGLRIDGLLEFLDVMKWDGRHPPEPKDFVGCPHYVDDDQLEVVQVSIRNISYDDVGE
jgi:hypothetical protein